MIVKNESQVINRCLGSVKKYIDYWVIVDTGSEDGTQDLIRDILSGVPGELYERKWVNFGHNRNEAMSLARNKGDYLFFIDADEQFVPESRFSWDFLIQESFVGEYYLMPYEASNGIIFYKASVIKNVNHFFWYGIIHEHIASSTYSGKGIIIPLAKILYLTGGARSLNPKTSEEDIKLLIEASKKNPSDLNIPFYLGLTYRKEGRYKEALEAFFRRTEMPEVSQQKFYSWLLIGELQQNQLGEPSEVYLKSFEKAYQLEPMRPEPLYVISQHLLSVGQWRDVEQLLYPIMKAYDPNIGYQLYYCKRAAEVLVPMCYAQAIYELGNKDGAVSVLKRALNSNEILGADRELIDQILLKIV